MKDHLNVHAVIRRVRSSSGGSRSNRSSRGSSSGSCNIINHGEFKVLVLGANGVGKTSICKRYVGLSDEDVDDIAVKNEGVPYDTSVFISSKDGEIQQYDLEIYDTDCDLQPKDRRTEIEKVDGYLLVYAKDSSQSVAKLMDIISDIKHIKHDNNPPMLVVCNKSDLKDSVVQQDFPLSNIQILPVSATKNEGLQTAFNLLVEKCVSKKEEIKKE